MKRAVVHYTRIDAHLLVVQADGANHFDELDKGDVKGAALALLYGQEKQMIQKRRRALCKKMIKLRQTQRETAVAIRFIEQPPQPLYVLLRKLVLGNDGVEPLALGDFYEEIPHSHLRQCCSELGAGVQGGTRVGALFRGRGGWWLVVVVVGAGKWGGVFCDITTQ